MTTKKNEVSTPPNVQDKNVSDDVLAKLGTLEPVLTLNKEPLQMEKGEVIQVVLYNKYERELKEGKKAKYITLMDKERNLFFSGSSVLVNALCDMDLYVAVQIAYEGTETTENGFELQLYQVTLLNA